MPCENEWCDPEIGNDCLECFQKRAAAFGRVVSCMDTDKFKGLAARFKEAQVAADGILKEIQETYSTDYVCWWVNANNDVLPQHRTPPDYEP